LLPRSSRNPNRHRTSGCPFSAPEKQALLEAPSGDDRLAALIALLEMALAEPDDGARFAG
jgi:Lon protease-like protein